MIQRIQTVYLLVALICLSLLFVFPFSTYTLPEADAVFNTLGLSNGPATVSIFPVVMNVVIAIVLLILSIISFKNRKRQMLFNKLNYLTIIILLIFIFVDFNIIEKKIEVENEAIHYGIGMFLPIIALVALGMASRAIKKDEDLIKSMDRIR